ncbi:MAG: FAD-dependent oxidoreductase [Acetobacteraceae bacterium]
MTIYNVKLTGKQEIAKDTMEFFLEKPAGFEFRAGQFCDITLKDPPETDAKGNVRGFSFVTAPSENRLAVATRLRDTAFKRVFRKLPDNTVVELDAPYGDFTLQKSTTAPAVFIIGGIGVTPVRSIIAQATHDRTNHHITLIHANRTAADAPFAADFKQLAQQNRNFTYVPVYTDSPSDKAVTEHGRVTADIVKRQVANVAAPVYYLAGPQGMVKAMRELLIKIGANEDNIRTEEFEGY